MQRRQASPTDVTQRGSCYVNYVPAATQHRRVLLQHQVECERSLWLSNSHTPSQSDTNQVSSVSPNEAARLTHSTQVFSAVVVGGKKKKKKLRGANLPRWRNPDSCFYTHTVTELLGKAMLPQILSGVVTCNHFILNCGCLPMFADDDDVSVLTLID